MARPKKRPAQPTTGAEAADVLIKLLRVIKVPVLELEIVMAALLLKLASTQWQECRGSAGEASVGAIPKLAVPNGLDFTSVFAEERQDGFAQFVKVIRAFVAVNPGRLHEGQRSVFPLTLGETDAIDISLANTSELYRVLEFIDGLPCFEHKNDTPSRHAFLLQLQAAIYSFCVPKLKEDDLGYELSDAVVDMVSSQCTDLPDGAVIYDPCCGAGGLAVGIFARIRAVAPIKSLGLIGAANSWRSWSLATCAMAVAGASEWFVSTPGKKVEIKKHTATVVVTNLVGAGKSANSSPIPYFSLLDELTDGLVDARADVVCLLANKSLLYRDGEELRFRKRWIDNNKLELVADVPDGMVKGIRGATALVVLRSHRTQRDVSFVDLGHLQALAGKPLMALAPDFADVRAAGEGSAAHAFAGLVGNDDIAAKHYNLNPVRYLTDPGDVPLRPLAEIQQEINALLNDASTIGIRIQSSLNAILQAE